MAEQETVRVRFDVRIPQDMYDFLEEESRLKKLSFEGLFLLYVRDRMNPEKRR